jgi:hypothetical protein
MTSIFRTAMGPGFDRLHPALRRRFSVGLAGGEACTGRGVMDRIWHGPAFVKPFLALGATRNILVPRAGRNIPFVLVGAEVVEDAVAPGAEHHLRVEAAGRPEHPLRDRERAVRRLLRP